MNSYLLRPSEPYWADITPAIATELLKLNKNNRPIKPQWVNFLTSAMLEGRFKESGDSIKFSNTNQLIDGQHRLLACVRSGVSIRSIVACGLDPEVFKVIDSGAKRTVSDVFAGFDLKNYTAIAAAARTVHIINQMMLGSSFMNMRKQRFTSDSAVLEIADGAYDFSNVELELTIRNFGFTRSSLMAFVVLGRRAGKTTEALQSFLDGGAKRANLNEGDPRIALSGWATRNTKIESGVRSHITVIQLIRAFNACELNKQIDRFNTPSVDSPFPLFSTNNTHEEQ